MSAFPDIPIGVTFLSRNPSISSSNWIKFPFSSSSFLTLYTSISIYSLHAYTAMVRVTGADIQDILKKIKDIPKGRWTGEHKNNIVANMLYTFSTVSGIDTGK